MTRPQVREVQCRSALNRVGGMGFRWSLNPYRGCQHGCAYCFARATHTFLELDAGDDFSGVVFAKVNVAHVLRLELSARAWRRERVQLGTCTDPYQPIEARYRLTRACIEALCDFRNPFGIVTKGPLIVRDADLFAGRDVTVCISVPTVDAEIWRRIEPGTADPLQRLRAVRRLSDAGVRVGVLLAPLLPGLTTGERAVEAGVRAAAEHGARFVAGNLLYLKPGVKEVYLSALARHYPALLPRYERLYPGASAFAPHGYAQDTRRRVAAAAARHGVAERARAAPRQLRLEL